MIVVPQIRVTAERIAFGDRDAVEIARTFAAQGARGLQLWDPDGHLASAPGTPRWLAALLAAAKVPVQYDGALCDSAAIEDVSRLGFDTVVVGMHALFDPMFLRWAIDLLGDRTVVELQVDGEHLFDPPRGSFGTEVVEAVRQLRFQGVRHVLYRDITALEVPLERLRRICADEGMPVTYSGPVRSAGDLEELAFLRLHNLRAVAVGSPLFDGRIRLAEANRIADGADL